MQHLSPNKKQKEALPTIRRSKLYSLRFLNPKAFEVEEIRSTNKDVFKKLEKSLERDNKEEQPLAEPTPILPDQYVDVQDDTIWNQFQQQASKVQGKVTQERVNCYEKEFMKLKKKHKQTIAEIAKNIESLQGTAKQKYKQIHILFQQIKQERSVIQLNTTVTKGKKNKKQDPLMIVDNSCKIVTLKQSIQDLRKEVAQIEKNIHSYKKQTKNQRHQWVCFLRKMLREDYFLKKGVVPILQEMVEAKYKPKKQDLPKCLDQISQKCLLEQYKALLNAKPKYLHKRVNSEPKSKINSLVQSQLIRDIYKGTKEFMSQLVKQASWKNQVILPPINRSSQQELHSDWRQNQRKRLSHVYTGEKYTRSKTILFGPKVETLG